MRLKFWQWAHNAAERLWHWIYYKRLKPLDPAIPQPESRFFFSHQIEPSPAEKEIGIVVKQVYRSF